MVVIGAQAIYLHTAGAAVAVAEATKDSDLAIDPRTLRNVPLIEKAMERAGLYPDPEKNQPGAWLNPDGIPVDLMVPEHSPVAALRGHEELGFRRTTSVRCDELADLRPQLTTTS